MAVATYTKTGTKATTPATLDKSIFDVEVKNHQLLKDAYVAYLANGRANLAVTKTRGEVRGGGRKPWRQKGTGRARFGSSRNPIWSGGGVAFGPTGQENYTRKLNVKAKRLALKQALSLAANEDRIKVIETFDATDGKVKKTLELMKKWDAKGRTVIVVSKKEALDTRATGNIPNVESVQASGLSVVDVLDADTIVISKKSLDMLSDRLGDKK
jgi:large subunit ribosomal protein L4